MNVRGALIVAVFFAAGPALAQVPASGTQPKPPVHQQPGTPAPSAESKAPAAPASPVEAKVDPAKEAAIRHLMDITETSKMGDNIKNAIANQVQQVIARAIQPEQLPKFMETFTQKFSASAPSGAVTDAVVPIYARHFSMEDIQGLIQFYESPLGRRVVKTMPELVQESQQNGAQMDQKAAIDVLRGMSDEYPQLKQMLPPDKTAPAAAPAPGATPAPEPQPAPAPPKP